jgi:hypothetical protein
VSDRYSCKADADEAFFIYRLQIFLFESNRSVSVAPYVRHIQKMTKTNFFQTDLKTESKCLWWWSGMHSELLGLRSWSFGTVNKLALCKESSIVSVSLTSLEDENTSIFRNLMFPGYLEFRMRVKVHKLSDSKLFKNSGYNSVLKFISRY